MGERRLNSPQPGGYPQDERMTGIPRTVLEMQNARMHSISVANLSGHVRCILIVSFKNNNLKLVNQVIFHSDFKS